VPAPVGSDERPRVARFRANLLGPFSISLGQGYAGPWARPSARRLCQLVLLSPERRISRELAGEALFPNLSPAAAGRALSKALSMARKALSGAGAEATGLLQANHTHIWFGPGAPLEVDLDLQEERLRAALTTEPGAARDDQLVLALSQEGELLEDEPTAEWAVRPRERLEWARQEARLTLARDRAQGFGRSQPTDVVRAWEACLSHDPTCEEAASALMWMYAAQAKHALVEATYKRCRVGLEELGLRVSPALREVHAATTSADISPPAAAENPTGLTPLLYREERRLVSVLFAELSGPGGAHGLDPEDLRDVVGKAVAELISEVELLGGTITSVSGAGLAALFGAPLSHEDDPERAVRAGYRMLSALGGSHALSLRIGIETGQAVVGPIGRGGRLDYGAVGDVVGAAAALQSVAKQGSVLVGPATRAAVEPLFSWGPTEEVATSPGGKPVAASYVQRPAARPLVQVGRRRFAGSAPLVGRGAEIGLLRSALREAIDGKGGVVLIAGEPGLGKTRLVHECRQLFMAWVGGASGRLPLWLEGRAASYASSRPYGLYQQLLAAWVGVAPEEGEEVARPVLERAMKAIFGGQAGDHARLLGQVMGLGPGRMGPGLDPLSPEELQQATFAALRSVVSRLVSHGPTVLVLEDLHWADPTSLRLTEELSSLVKEGPLLFIMTRRPEPDPGVSSLELALGADPGHRLRILELSPLAEGDARDLARALLGKGAPDPVIEAVSRGAEGNPLFLEERLSSLVETLALVMDETGWRLERGAPDKLPEALERLVRSRVDRLDPALQDALVAASVLGEEFSLPVLGIVTGTNGQLVPAVAELCTSGLLTELRKAPEPVYRFRHGLIQEAIYKGLLRQQRRRLHARAAWGLEGAAANRLEEVAGVLGHHCAMAGETDRAVHFLEVAGDHAASAFANDEAIASYRRGLALVSEAGKGQQSVSPVGPDRAGPSPNLMAKAAVGLRAKLAEVLLRTGHHAEAREALNEACQLLGGEDRLQGARLQALLGRVEIADHRHDAAMAAFDAADKLLGEHPEDRDQATVDLWLEVQLDGRAYVHYWRNEPAEGAEVLAKARRVVEARGTPARRRTFHMSFALQRMRESRYRVDQETLTNMRAAVAAALEGGAERDVAFTTFGLGFCLLWRDDLDEAQERLEASLATAGRIGDAVLRARCLCYLNVVALRRHDVGTVRSLAPQAIAAADAASYPEYVAAAKATQAWVAWQDGRLEDVFTLATEALDLWRTTVVSYSWHWLCLWPLIAARLARGQVAQAVEAGHQLLVPPQQLLPDELDASVRAAIGAWEDGEAELAAQTFGQAVELAQRLRYA
jgi:class 3 adenylate cyclase